MRNLYKFFLIIIGSFIVDSTISYFLPYNFASQTITIIPYLGLMFFTLLVRHLDNPENYFLAALCGIYYSVVYSRSLAIYILIYFMIAFVRCLLMKIEKLSIVESSMFCVVAIGIGELIVYWLMWVTHMTSIPLASFLLMRLLPTLIFNFIASYIVYFIYLRIPMED